MALQSQTQIYIGNTPIHSFKQFVLDQDINAHHILKLQCRTDILEELGGELSNVTKNYLGETLTIQVTSLSQFIGYKELEFKGLVTSVSTRRGYNNESIVTITAESPTILCDDGPHYGSHLDKTLSDIINETLSGYDSSFKFNVKPENTSTIHYSVQHKESNWRYLSRLAMQYSEWFYYDGKKLVFGKVEGGEDVTLMYGHDLQGFSIDLVPLPNNFKYFTNDYLTDEQHEKKTADVQTGVNGYNGFASDKSKTLYAKETNVWVNGYNDPQLKQRMDTQVEQQTKVVEQKQVRVIGDSDNPGITIGKIINIKDDSGSHGRYKVIRVKHLNNENGQYRNSFTAVSADIDVFPDTNFEAFPKSETQTAVVFENKDPKGMARIQVQFPWQKPIGETTPFIRVVTPHGGGDKGFHFIPEKGEEVLIGFEGGNAERPYMMGSLYNGSAAAGAFDSDANDIKALQTRSGNKVIMNDSDGSITIADPSGNVIIMQGNGEVLIQAPNKLTLASTDINILAGNKIYLQAKPNEESGGDGIIAMTAQKSFDVKAIDESISMKAKADVTFTSETASMNLKGETDTNVKGKNVKLLASNELSAHGSSKNKISGGKVEINKG